MLKNRGCLKRKKCNKKIISWNAEKYMKYAYTKTESNTNTCNNNIYRTKKIKLNKKFARLIHILMIFFLETYLLVFVFPPPN